MRLRKKPWADREFSINKTFIEQPAENKGKWKVLFGNDNPIHIEIGCGKGKFISETSIRNPHINYIAIERSSLVIVSALRKSREMNVGNNLVFFCADVKDLEEYFSPAEISRIYINFCDPWENRKKWAKRRLTHKNFLNIYENLFKDKGEIFFKTDNTSLFEFSLNEFCLEDWMLRNISLDLHKNNPEDNVNTEYEEKFSQLGMPIYRLEAYYKSKTER